MIDRILVRYGDLVLKGHNKKRFIKTARLRVKEKLDNPNIEIKAHHDRLYVLLNGEQAQPIIKRLKMVPGLLSFSPMVKTDKTMETIQEEALTMMQNIKGPSTFKVETKRADKRFPISSQIISKTVGGYVLKNTTHLTADMHEPNTVLHVEIRQDHAFLYHEVIEGMKGFPLGTMGQGLCLLSGGIDSPVAAYLAMKKGIEVELMHFESTPLTSIESAQKAIDLAKQLAQFGINNTIKLHMVPFERVHTSLLNKMPEPYMITMMRRMMVKIAEAKAHQTHIPVLINGESIGQVASQTLESMKVTDHAVSLPMIRPLAIMEKNDIMRIARMIGTYEISIQPFEDCCTVYVPKQVATSPRVFYALRYEKLIDMDELINKTVANIKTLSIHQDDVIKLTDHGLTVEDALKVVRTLD